MISEFINIVDKLLVYPENMKMNLELTGGLILSQSVLLALTKKGMKREDAYALVQKFAMDVWKNRGSFKDKLESDITIKSILTEKEIDEIFDLKKCLVNVDYIFNKVGI